MKRPVYKILERTSQKIHQLCTKQDTQLKVYRENCALIGI
jgi:hypothetical protein